MVMPLGITKKVNQCLYAFKFAEQLLPYNKMYCPMFHVLMKVVRDNYLCITSSFNIEWSPYISNFSAKANDALAFLDGMLNIVPISLNTLDRHWGSRPFQI